ncbi:hypothetical protein SAMN05216266_112180 [Amycolatopsis marina]|uniref:Uncharacterized protein n=1 Tax=Amycolatopsis marina TaxID=490629 RepID=A0A1I1B8H4_9PSEU|nr:hypothetical protein [Amycolatopsis marina]SFB46377.1 hypothetical protein SAMN05216266_112180 [Amycolatopsis marina]
MIIDRMMYDAVRAEAAYRAEEMHKSGRLVRIVTSRRSNSRRKHGGSGGSSRSDGEVAVPRQRTGVHDHTDSVRTDRAA